MSEEKKYPTKLIKRVKRHKSFIFITDAGEFTAQELADLFGVSVFKITSTYKKYGFDVERMRINHYGSKPGPPEGAQGKRGSWEGLSSKSRLSALDSKLKKGE